MSAPQNAITQAVAAIQSGGVIAVATEGAIGLSCDPNNATAIERLLSIKQRPASKGLILLAADIQQLLPFIAPLEPLKLQQLEQALKASSTARPITYLVKAHPTISRSICGDFDTVAVRLTNHDPVKTLCTSCGHALISTSANRSNQPTVYDLEHLDPHIAQQVDYVLESTIGPNASASEIRDFASGAIIRSFMT